MCLLSPLLLDLSRNTLLPKFRPIFAIWNHFGIYISFNYSPQKQYSENKLGLRGLLEILNIPNITPPTAVIHVPLVCSSASMTYASHGGQCQLEEKISLEILSE